VPTLRRGGVVIVDNLPAQKRIAVQAAVAALLFLPRYPPEPELIGTLLPKAAARHAASSLATDALRQRPGATTQPFAYGLG